MSSGLTWRCWCVANMGLLTYPLLFIFLLVLSVQYDGGLDEVLDIYSEIFETLYLVIPIGVLGIFWSVKVAQFAYNNFDEVTSRQMRWRNSNVSMHDARLGYWFNRFIVSFFLYTIILSIILFLLGDAIL